MSKSASVFRKFHGIPDRQLMGAIGQQAMQADLAAKVINHNARVLIKLIALGVVNAAATMYLAYELLWRVQ